MEICRSWGDKMWDSEVKPRRSLVGAIRKSAPKPAPKPKIDPRPSPKIAFTTKHEAELWAEIYADESCHPFHRWEVERFGGGFSVGIYDLNSGKFSHWAEP